MSPRSQVRLGVDEPHDIDVHREEIFLRVQVKSESQTDWVLLIN